MSKVGFLWVGKLKERFSQDGCAHYWKKLSRFFQLEETVIKDAPGKLPPADKSKVEGERILAKVKPGDVLIILDEFGERMTSKTLADRLQTWTDAPNQRPVFVIGGPFGLSDEVKNAARHSIRLSDMTLPHELARLLLLEQLYRAGTIHKNMPYHHE
ncbi:23S rRNA (pseudouridine(1915)-N(3))-methyltransferase RlmH [Pseudodesulfovibrio indicus]|uniref:Ribosomal RNA large subunit methyltransferase H n=1 Tax=Pseudodesulfovibrio indicus TaxID=1716143 RepID=A0A140D940_9BACT|nr:23S rRNA (pseudouridine(1915)-N(3))-methyltransferase RlmH [Pseudodesulfovibrio indicus]AMK09707.1 50S rRNA methyltransferase [Pseudodesulfovibrio indicus]TDT86336.1 23S rRNA (pseudouridine1915-N3)-methyltransferase [Pseudodesulfovibrio indicus]